jgi:hypothetical protein
MRLSVLKCALIVALLLPVAAMADGAPPHPVPSTPPAPAMLPVDPAVIRDTMAVLQQEIGEKCGAMVGVIQRLNAAEASAPK